MSFDDYVKEQRTWHVGTPPPQVLRPGVPLDADNASEQSGGSARGAPRRSRRRHAGNDPPARLRYVRPIVAPYPFTDPLPYEDPLERAARYIS